MLVLKIYRSVFHVLFLNRPKAIIIRTLPQIIAFLASPAVPGQCSAYISTFFLFSYALLVLSYFSAGALLLSSSGKSIYFSSFHTFICLKHLPIRCGGNSVIQFTPLSAYIPTLFLFSYALLVFSFFSTGAFSRRSGGKGIFFADFRAIICLPPLESLGSHWGRFFLTHSFKYPGRIRLPSSKVNCGVRKGYRTSSS